MSGLRVWVRPNGLVLAHRPDGWPMPADWPKLNDWPWRGDTWPCHDPRWRPCQAVACWRTTDGRTRGYYCGAHLWHRKPKEPPSPLCDVCSGPLDPSWHALGETTHPCCDPRLAEGAEGDHDVAIALLATLGLTR
jgi:hypothetical protein